MSNKIPEGYKWTEVGVIPNDWHVEYIDNVADVIGGGTPSTKIPRYWNGKINWFVPSEIGENKYSIKSNRTITNEGLVNSSAKLLPINSILLTSRATIGETSILKEPSCTNQGFQSLVPNKKINNEFLYYLINTQKSVLIKNASGSTYLEISPKNLRSIQIQYPPNKKEQKAIATALSDVDELIENLQELIAKKRAIKKGAMQELLNGNTRLHGFEEQRGYKKTECGLIPKDWRKRSISDIVDIVGGGTPNTKIKEYWDGTINWFVPSEIGSNKYSYKSDRTISSKGLRNSSAKLLPKNSILLTTRATIGETSILKKPSCTNQGFQSLIPKEDNIDYEFLYYLINTMKKILIKNASGSTYLEIRPKHIKSIIIYIPTKLEEQKAIAKILSDIDSEIEALEHKLNKYKKIKKGMMQQLLTGKVRLI